MTNSTQKCGLCDLSESGISDITNSNNNAESINSVHLNDAYEASDFKFR